MSTSRYRVVTCVLLCCACMLSIHSRSEGQGAAKVKPEVLTLIRQATDAYKRMKSYSADVSLKTEQTADAGSRSVQAKYVLALDRANRFCYRDMTDPKGTAAVSDGKKLINYKSDVDEFMESPAPADYKGINIVDDVLFEPLGTYMIALMLQGDALADKDIRASIEKATLAAAPVTENGKSWVVLHMTLGPQEERCDVYFSEDHLVGKSVTTAQGQGVKTTVTEQITNVKIDKPVDPAVFLYSPPTGAHKVQRFTSPQRPGDAYLQPTDGGLHLASFESEPQIRGLDPAVKKLIDQAAEAYNKLTSYRHVAVFRAAGTKDGAKVDQSAKFSLAMARPNKLSFKMVSHPNVAAVSDGKTFTDYRIDENGGEYVRAPAPQSLKQLQLDQDDFDPVAGSYLIALLLQDRAYSDPKLLGILIQASAHTGIKAASKTWDALDFQMPRGLKFVMYFDPTTHMLAWAAAKVPDQDLTLTETFENVELNKPIPDSEFTFALPAKAKHVSKL